MKAQTESPVPYASNDVRLSARQWAAVVLAVSAVLAGTPVVWRRIEPLEAAEDYRIPYALSEDYWMYGRLAERRARQGKTVVIGDSVMWGEFVTPGQTLSHCLNQQSGSDRFVNCGLNGVHPLALEGLARYYLGPAAGGKILLHCNLLWMCSEEQDLQTDKEVSFNHPKLVPQFAPRIAAYQASTAERLGVVIDRVTPFRGWVNHLRVAYFDSQDLHTWSLEHPYNNPFHRITLRLPLPDSQPRHSPVPWSQRGVKRQDFPWVDLDSSLQWGAFRRTAELVRRRGGDLFVMVGPLNEHMLTDQSRARHGLLRNGVEAWLEQAGIPHYAPRLLPSSQYGDASHPLAAGYAQLARELLADEAFQRWLSRLTRPS
jgi:hypothetical protein